jgi:hypothetical protein
VIANLLPSPHQRCKTTSPTRTLVPRFPDPIPMSYQLRNLVLSVQDRRAPFLQNRGRLLLWKMHPAPASGAGQEMAKNTKAPGCRAVQGRWGIMEGGRSTLLSMDVCEHGQPVLGGHKRELCWRIFGFGDFISMHVVYLV